MKSVLAFVIALVVGVGLGIVIDRTVLNGSGDEFSAVTIEEKIKEVSELSVLEMDYTAQEDWKGEAKKVFGKEIPLTSKSMQLIFSGIVKAGPNLEEMNIEAGENDISVTLPHSDILSHEIDEDSIQIQYVKNGVFNRVTPKNMNEVRKKAKETKEKEIRDSDFLKQADDKSVEQIKSFLETAYPDATVTVSVK